MKRFLPILLLGFASAAPAATLDLIVPSTSIDPGQTLRVEVDGAPSDKLKAVFRGRSYALFPVGPNAQRALIGIALGTAPGDFPLKIRRAGAPNDDLPGLAPMNITVSSKAYVVENIHLPPQKNKLVPLEARESAKIHRAARMVTARQYWEGPFIPPVQGPELAPFGKKRMHNGTVNAGFHNGIDLRAPAGASAKAANAGIVILAVSFRAHGKVVLINHGQGVMTVYLHMQSIAVRPGQMVRKGQTIGKVGSTGVSTGPHIHWQVFVHGVPVDPEQWQNTEF